MNRYISYDLAAHSSSSMKYFYQGCRESLTKYIEARVIDRQIDIDLENFIITPELIHHLIYSFVEYACREHNGMRAFQDIQKGLLVPDEKTFFTTLGQMLILGDSRGCIDRLIESFDEKRRSDH